MEILTIRDPAGQAWLAWTTPAAEPGLAHSEHGVLYLLSSAGECRRVVPIPPHWKNAGRWLWRLCQRFGEDAQRGL